MEDCVYTNECFNCPKAVPLKRYDKFLIDIIYCYCTEKEEFTQLMPEDIYEQKQNAAITKKETKEEPIDILDEFEEDLLI